MNKPKVIGVGFQKTGTTTLMDALEVLGYKVSNNNTKLLYSIRKNDYSKVIKELELYDAAEDNPWPMIYKEVDKLLPGCKFVLTIRDPEKWLKSVKNHFEQPKIMHDWIYGKGKSMPEGNEDHFLNVYNTHNKEVIEYFKDRPEDLLVIDFTKGEKWDKLCKFLGIEIPEQDFPHRNKTASVRKDNLKKKLKRRRQRMKYLILSPYFSRLDRKYKNNPSEKFKKQ